MAMPRNASGALFKGPPGGPNARQKMTTKQLPGAALVDAQEQLN